MAKTVVVVNIDDSEEYWRIQRMDYDCYEEICESISDDIDTSFILLESYTNENDIIDTVSSKDEAIQIAKDMTQDYQVLEIF